MSHNFGFQARNQFISLLTLTMGGEQKFPSAIELPIIDFKDVYSGGTLRKKQAENLIDAFTTYGFCLISNLADYCQEDVFKAIK